MGRRASTAGAPRTSGELARDALRIAGSAIDAALAELGDGVPRERELLVRASDAVRAAPRSTPRERAIQHMAFALISALFDAVREPERRQ
jgi:hypothetical protein